MIRAKRAFLMAVLLLGAAIVFMGVVLATRRPPVNFADVRPEIEPIEPEMVTIPAGSFMMGNPDGTPQEQPVHEVYLSEYSIQRYETTTREYKRFVEATGRYHPPNPLFYPGGSNYFLDNPDHPAVEMSWNDAAAYCEWLKIRTGKDYHLPTEAQWEKAARGGKDTIYHWGDEPIEGMANMNTDWSGGPKRVGSYPPNDFGIYDMVGNVNEMVADWYEEDYFSKSPKEDPIGPSGLEAYVALINPEGRSRLKGRCKVVKGGSYRATFDWDSYNPDGMKETPVQPGAREYVYLEPYTHFDLGFRCAMGGVH